MSMINLKDTVGNRTRDLPVCSTGMKTDYFLCQAETKFLSIISLYFTLNTGRLSGQTDRQTGLFSDAEWLKLGLILYRVCWVLISAFAFWGTKPQQTLDEKKEQDWRTRAHNNTQTNLHRTSISIEVKNKRLQRSKKCPLHYLNRGLQHRTHQVDSSSGYYLF
jgi:hypothetical protein